jgi:methionyl-tRNA formyltransferase
VRIAVCTKYDVLGIRAINRLLPLLSGHDVRLFFSTKTRDAETVVPELKLMKLLERDIITDIVFRLAEAAEGMAAPAATPSQLAARTGAPATFLRDLKPGGDRPLLLDFRPDLVISVRFSLIFPRSLIVQVPRGILNVHPGPLPAYRGLYAPFWQMLNGEDTLGCTVHLVDPGLDTGDVLSIERIPYTPGRSMLWHALHLYFAGVDRIAVAINAASLGKPILGAIQDHSMSSHYRYPTAADFLRFRDAGHELVTPEDYCEIVSAFTPTVAAPQYLAGTALASMP